MRFKHYLFITSLFALTLSGCSKSDNTVTPATTSTADLLVRKWSFADLSVKTDAKSYAVPAQNAAVYGDDNTVTFNKANTYTYPDNGKTITGTWKLSNNDKTLTMTDANTGALNLTVNSISSTNVELATINVTVGKANPSTEENQVGLVSGLLLASLDKQYGGTIDFTKEPTPKTLQLVLKGKAL